MNRKKEKLIKKMIFHFGKYHPYTKNIVFRLNNKYEMMTEEENMQYLQRLVKIHIKNKYFSGIKNLIWQTKYIKKLKQINNKKK